MGNGWGDVFAPQVWFSVMGNPVWRRLAVANNPRCADGRCGMARAAEGSRLLLLIMGQLILLAGVGHAAMNDGPTGGAAAS